MKKAPITWKEFQGKIQRLQGCTILYQQKKRKQSIRGVITSIEQLNVGAPGYRITVKTETGETEQITLSSWLDEFAPKELEEGEIELILNDGVAIILPNEKEGEMSFTM